MEDIKTIEQKENPLFNRKEIKIEIKAEVTPKQHDVKKLVSEKFSSNPENIKIKKIFGNFGSNYFTIIANIYGSKKDMDNVETKSKKDIEMEKESSPEKPQEASA